MQKIKKVALVGFYHNKKQILMQERWDYSKYGEEWAFFWWHIEEWETAEEAMIREAKEELDIDMSKLDYQYVWEFILDFPEYKVYRHIFLVKTDKKESDFTVLELSGAKYFDIEDAKTLKVMTPIWESLDIIKKHMLV